MAIGINLQLGLLRTPSLSVLPRKPVCASKERNNEWKSKRGDLEILCFQPCWCAASWALFFASRVVLDFQDLLFPDLWGFCLWCIFMALPYMRWVKSVYSLKSLESTWVALCGNVGVWNIFLKNARVLSPSFGSVLCDLHLPFWLEEKKSNLRLNKKKKEAKVYVRSLKATANIISKF